MTKDGISSYDKTTASGFVLLVASLLEVFVILHHPSVDTADIAQTVQAIAGLSTRSAEVHGALIAIMLLIANGLIDFARRRGASRPLIRAGGMAYGCGVIVMMGAALVSGFITPGVASLAPHVTATDLQINRQIFLLCRVLNQSCANVGAVAMSTGILIWAADLMRGPGALRAVGILGSLVAVVPALALMLGWARLDVHGITELVATQALWTTAVALLLILRVPLETSLTRPVFNAE